MRQDNSIHIFHSLMYLVLGIVIGVMLLYIANISSCVTPGAHNYFQYQKEEDERAISPQLVRKPSPTPDLDELAYRRQARQVQRPNRTIER
jgi:hypothetical protein